MWTLPPVPVCRGGSPSEHAVQRQNGLLLAALDRYAANVALLRRQPDGARIGCVVLVAAHEGVHLTGGNTSTLALDAVRREAPLLTSCIGTPRTLGTTPLAVGGVHTIYGIAQSRRLTSGRRWPTAQGLRSGLSRRSAGQLHQGLRSGPTLSAACRSPTL